VALTTVYSGHGEPLQNQGASWAAPAAPQVIAKTAQSSTPRFITV
jgi:hypothetical protein